MNHNFDNFRVTIITTFRNDFHELFKTIKSIQSQKQIDIYHILLDASDFKTQDEEIKKYFNLDNTLLISSKGLSQYFCINKGIGLVKTKFFLIINTGTTFVDILSIYNAIKNVSDENIIFNPSIVISSKGSLINKPNLRTLPHGVHHEACIYSFKDVKHDLEIGHIADLDFISRHLLKTKSKLINTRPLIYYPRGGVSDLKSIDINRVIKTIKVSNRLLLRRQFIASIFQYIR